MKNLIEVFSSILELMIKLIGLCPKILMDSLKKVGHREAAANKAYDPPKKPAGQSHAR